MAYNLMYPNEQISRWLAQNRLRSQPASKEEFKTKTTTKWELVADDEDKTQLRETVTTLQD